MTYEQALSDWKALWAVGPAYDMTGGYVDQDDLDALLKSPNKRTAKNCLMSQIAYWFQVGPDSGVDFSGRRTAEEVLADNPHLYEIALRHGFEHLVPEEHRDD